jgi:hypothetical protein
LKINLRVEYVTSGAKDVTCTASDLVAFESKFNLSVTKLGEETKLTHLLYLAWNSEKRTKATTLDFEPWIETVVTVGASDLDPK